jgi:hypothetical protein
VLSRKSDSPEAAGVPARDSGVAGTNTGKSHD